MHKFSTRFANFKMKTFMTACCFLGTLSACPLSVNASEALTETSTISPETTYPSPLAPHRASYEAFFGSISLGKASFELFAPDQLGKYRYQFNTDLSLLLLSDSRQLSSEFSYEPQAEISMKSLSYNLQREGTGRNHTESILFSHDLKRVFSTFKGEKGNIEYSEALFDPLTIQLKLRQDLALGTMQDTEYQYVSENRIKKYKFEQIGSETLTLPAGQFDTIQLKISRNGKKKRQTFVWFAPSLGYLPVQIMHYDDIGDDEEQIRMVLLDYAL